MISSARALLFALAISTTCDAASAQEVSANSPDPGPNIELELLVVQIPMPAAMAIVRELKDDTTRKLAVEKVHKAIDDGSAKIIGWPTVTVISGYPAMVEAVTEYRFAAEFAPAGVEVTFNGKEGKIEPAQVRAKGTEFNAIATQFETRNVGVTLEVAPTLDANGTTIHLDLKSQHVRLTGTKKITIEGAKAEDKVVVEQPLFEVFKVSNAFAMQSGDEKLIGVFPTTEPAGFMELFLFRAEVRKPQKP